ncbi:transcriptional regulator [Streptomyces brasiliensis]|uniref:Transcriptional regulator n=1 Tax=Streptomyces brasiliensis TaxID=1954 RepID=A0A917L069_9ACTN|nr:transcriptional regulator [Streptomyces brasiliensis]
MLHRHLAAVRAGHSAVVVLRGEAGIGKTALLEYLSGQAHGCRIVRAAGAESEMELAFGGLHQLCAPFLDQLDRLPDPQRAAIETAFGMSAGTPPDRFLVGLAVLSLLADVAQQTPLICLVDDAQWLDHVSAQILGFVARRLMAEQVGLFFAVREPDGERILQGLPELVVEGLREPDARALLESAIPGRFDERIRSRILAEARGNPLALLELPRTSSAADLAGGFASPGPRPLASRLQHSFILRVRALPPVTRRLLLLAAAEPIGDVSLLRRAAEKLGISTDAASPALTAGLLKLGTRVRFRHPLVRTAIYHAAALPERREVHRALAEVTDARSDPDRRAWHLARAAAGPDETVAGELERSAGRAWARGGIAAAAAFLERAAELTPDPSRRGTRALAAARAKYQAGAFDAALELLAVAELSALDDLERAQSSLLRGQITFGARSAGAAVPLLLKAARQLEPLDAEAARETYRDAFYAALTAGRLPSGPGIEEIARAVRTAPRSPRPGRTGLLLDGLAAATADSYSAGAPMLRRALTAFRSESISSEEGLGWLPFACRMAHNVWDFESYSVLSANLVDLARETGALSVLPSALLLRLSNRVFAGDLAGADSLAVEAVTIGEATGSRFMAQYGALVIESWRGREAATRQAVDAVTSDGALRGEGKVLTATQWALAVLYNGLGRYEEAYAAAEQGCEHPQELGLSSASLVELVEAAARSGKQEIAAEATDRLAGMAQASGTDWALGISAGARALISDGEAADALYREAIERLEAAQVGAMLARARLLYGEWLRRENRRVEARAQLSTAYETLSRIGAEAFAERARRELEAIGETVRKRVLSTGETLTPREAQIARLAGDGLTNPEIGAQLFLSPHTVEWHLRKVFAKLGIASRKQLRATLLEGTAAPA